MRILIAFLAALFLPLALTGAAASWSAGAHHESHRTWTVQVGNESHDQAIQGMAFLPENIYVNAGDTVRWDANSAEVHTVTFLARGQKLASFEPFNPSNPIELLKVGGSWYDGKSYYNSGVMTNVSNSGFPATDEYSLRFPKPGNYVYWCLVHGAMMKGVVHVRHEGTSYPYTQAQYDRYSAHQARAILRDGYHLWHETAQMATRHLVLAGNDDGVAMVMRFVHQTIRVHVGQTVTFTNPGMGAPHTVTFGTEPSNAFVPLGDPTHFAGGQLNSGLMEPGASFTVTFTKEGTFSYICALHDYMGMVGNVIVDD
ncbi:MAG TPA: plastocyanin/azurin family copper-binding protein [Amnibacterium sp.]|uniref:plastocyanin/azurin family copper-binding protein n=1 Tax=Amnibacterium sp. TaxID=1872496 RepID=UPI002F9395A6